MVKGKVRQARALETRKRLVAAAKKLITANGFDNVSIEDIAKEAGVSAGSFYTYFRKKEDVVEELNKSDFYRLAEIVNEREGEDLPDRLKVYCREYIRGGKGFLHVNDRGCEAPVFIPVPSCFFVTDRIFGKQKKCPEKRP